MLRLNNRTASPQDRGSAGASRAGDGAPPARTFFGGQFFGREIFSGSVISDRCFAAKRRKARAWRPRSPDVWRVALLVFLASLGICSAQDAVTPLESGELVISATRLPTLAEEVPASVSVLTAQDFENRQVERVADALRSVPGVSVVQSGTAVCVPTGVPLMVLVVQPRVIAQ